VAAWITSKNKGLITGLKTVEKDKVLIYEER
jgi:hypothetical protein